MFAVCRSDAHVKYCTQTYDEYLRKEIGDAESHHHAPELVEGLHELYPELFVDDEEDEGDDGEEESGNEAEGSVSSNEGGSGGE